MEFDCLATSFHERQLEICENFIAAHVCEGVLPGCYSHFAPQHRAIGQLNDRGRERLAIAGRAHEALPLKDFVNLRLWPSRRDDRTSACHHAG